LLVAETGVCFVKVCSFWKPHGSFSWSGRAWFKALSLKSYLFGILYLFPLPLWCFFFLSASWTPLFPTLRCHPTGCYSQPESSPLSWPGFQRFRFFIQATQTQYSRPAFENSPPCSRFSHTSSFPGIGPNWSRLFYVQPLYDRFPPFSSRSLPADELLDLLFSLYPF